MKIECLCLCLLYRYHQNKFSPNFIATVGETRKLPLLFIHEYMLMRPWDNVRLVSRAVSRCLFPASVMFQLVYLASRIEGGSKTCRCMALLG
jgi:hypothetical protein